MRNEENVKQMTVKGEDGRVSTDNYKESERLKKKYFGGVFIPAVSDERSAEIITGLE